MLVADKVHENNNFMCYIFYSLSRAKILSYVYQAATWRMRR